MFGEGLETFGGDTSREGVFVAFEWDDDLACIFELMVGEEKADPFSGEGYASGVSGAVAVCVCKALKCG